MTTLQNNLIEVYDFMDALSDLNTASRYDLKDNMRELVWTSAPCEMYQLFNNIEKSLKELCYNYDTIKNCTITLSSFKNTINDLEKLYYHTKHIDFLELSLNSIVDLFEDINTILSAYDFKVMIKELQKDLEEEA